MKATPEQRRAITTLGRSLLVEAGAGTGKTWVLVRRFLHLLEHNPSWPLESIVAITFTEKAAREMRTRIRKAVEEKAAEQPGSDSWQRRRRRLDRLRVSTVHGLCTQILRENAIVAAVDPRFEVLDEQESRLIQEEAITVTLARLVEEGSSILGLLEGLKVSDLRDELATLLRQRGTVYRLFKEEIDGPALLERWRCEYRALQEAEWSRLRRESHTLREALELLPTIEIIDPEDKLAPMVLAAQQGCRYLSEEKWAAAAGCFGQINVRGGKQANWGGKAYLEEIRGHLKAVREATRRLTESGYTTPFGADDELAIEALKKWKALWVALCDTYQRLKQERRALDFDDLEILTEQLLERQPRDERLASFLKEIRHLMVDEFQDTNETQQRIVYALAPPEEGQLFIVGDAKQSIYRFRQAQVSVFNETAEEIEQITGEPPLRLDRSFRTHRGLLAAFNSLFNRLFQPMDKRYHSFEARAAALFAEREAPHPHPAALAPVELFLLPKRDQNGENINARQARIWEAQRLARRLLELRDQAFPVWDKAISGYRAFQLHDAAILFRATTHMPIYEEAFKSLDIPYLAVSGRGYYERPEVQDLIALLAALHNPWDDLNLAITLRSPLFHLSDETLYRLRWHLEDGSRSPRPLPFHKALAAPPPSDQEDEVAFAAMLLSDLWKSTGRVTVWQLLRIALDRSAYEAALTLSDGSNARRQIRNVRKFLEMAGEWNSTTLSNFLRRIQNLRANEAREGEALAGEPEQGTAQLMTVHGAKGLEFPVVALVDLGHVPRGPSTSPRLLHDPAFGILCKRRDENGDWKKPAGYLWGEWLNRRMEVAEHKRLLYVACTRAADLLLLSGQSRDSGSWLDDLLQAWDIEMIDNGERLLEQDGYRLRVISPNDPPDTLYPEREAPQRDAPALEKLPPLAGSLPLTSSRQTLLADAVNHDLAEEAGELRRIGPVVQRTPEGSVANPWRNVASRITRQAINEWALLTAPAGRLRERLVALARRENLRGDAMQEVVERTLAAVARLQASPLFTAVQQAQSRYNALPFTVASSLGPLHGAIDLLYKDSSGTWHLVQWKCEWVDPESIPAEIERSRAKLATCRQAARSTLQCDPEVHLCFLVPVVVDHRYHTEELSKTWQSMVSPSDAARGIDLPAT